MDMDPVVFDSDGSGQQAAMDVDMYLGIEKKIRKKGLKRKHFDAPHNDNEVRCIGVLLDGTKFHSSVGRRTPSNFELGEGQVVIKEGDQGFETIRNASPLNSTLQFGVECLSWSSAEDNCKDGSILRNCVTDREKCKENLKELVKFEASPEDGSLVSKSERVEFTVNDGNFFEAVKKMKKGEVVVLTVKPQDGFPQMGLSGSDGKGDVPPNARPLTFELVYWKTFAEATDNKVLNKIVKGGEVCECPNDGTMEEDEDSDSPYEDEAQRIRESLEGFRKVREFREECRKAAEKAEEEAKEAMERDCGSLFIKYISEFEEEYEP